MNICKFLQISTEILVVPREKSRIFAILYPCKDVCSRVTTGISGFVLCSPWEAQTSLRVARESWGSARVTTGPKRPHQGVCPGTNIPLQGRQGSRGCIPGSPGSQASSCVEDGTQLASRVVHGVTGHVSSCVWNL